LSLQPSRHFCRSLIVVGSYGVCIVRPPLGWPRREFGKYANLVEDVRLPQQT
jgi:hypothetical protein